MPIRLKLALQFSAVTLLLLLTVGTLFVIDLRTDLQRSMDAGLRSRADDLIAQLRRTGAAPPSGRLLRLPAGSYGQVLRQRRPAGAVHRRRPLASAAQPRRRRRRPAAASSSSTA